MKKEKEREKDTGPEHAKPYVWVKDEAGNEFLCPADALKDVREASEEELDACIDVSALKPYAEDI